MAVRAAALSVGAAGGIGAAALLASGAGDQAGGIVMHSLITPAGAITVGSGGLRGPCCLAR